jgi:predicted RecB family nuclease
MHILTDRLLRDDLECNYKSYLRLQSQSCRASDFSALCSRLDARYRESAFKSLVTQKSAGAVEQFENTRVQDGMVRGDGLILNAVGSSGELTTHFDALERCSGESRLGTHRYRPIRFCRHQRPSSVLRLLLAFDALVLSSLQGANSADGIIVCGPAFRRMRIDLQTDIDHLAPILRRLRHELIENSEPPLVLNRHCDLCEFKHVCRNKAMNSDNLSLLKGMTSKEMTRYNAKGIFTINQLSYTFRLRRPAKRQKQHFRHNFALQALALREKTVHVHGDPKLSLQPIQVYLDIEGLPDRTFYYLIGVLIVTPQSHQYHGFWADDESGQTTIFAQFASIMAGNAGCKVFHYGNYEVSALRRMLPQLPDEHQETLKVVLSDSINILSILGQHIYFPTTSNSLKEIAAHLGFNWATSDASGLQSVVWREQWADTRDSTVKEKLLQYNREDCLALRAVTQFIASVARRESELQSEHFTTMKVIYTSELQAIMRRKHRFGKAEFCLADFQVINRSAYFDYQRSGANRRSVEYRKPSRNLPTKKRPRPKVNKRVEIRCKRCPHCGGRRVSEQRALSTRTVDIKFFNGGVKKWVTLYSA